jgi:hypothetical protein
MLHTLASQPAITQVALRLKEVPLQGCARESGAFAAITIERSLTRASTAAGSYSYVSSTKVVQPGQRGRTVTQVRVYVMQVCAASPLWHVEHHMSATRAALAGGAAPAAAPLWNKHPGAWSAYACCLMSYTVQVGQFNFIMSWAAADVATVAMVAVWTMYDS